MSLLSSVFLPKIERELSALEPDVSRFILRQLKLFAVETIEWAEQKLQLDLDGDGHIGGAE
jgi:hypothetical protein